MKNPTSSKAKPGRGIAALKETLLTMKLDLFERRITDLEERVEVLQGLESTRQRGAALAQK